MVKHILVGQGNRYLFLCLVLLGGCRPPLSRADIGTPLAGQPGVKVHRLGNNNIAVGYDKTGRSKLGEPWFTIKDMVTEKQHNFRGNAFDYLPTAKQKHPRGFILLYFPINPADAVRITYLPVRSRASSGLEDSLGWALLGAAADLRANNPSLPSNQRAANAAFARIAGNMSHYEAQRSVAQAGRTQVNVGTRSDLAKPTRFDSARAGQQGAASPLTHTLKKAGRYGIAAWYHDDLNKDGTVNLDNPREVITTDIFYAGETINGFM